MMLTPSAVVILLYRNHCVTRHKMPAYCIGKMLAAPQSRYLSGIGPRCHELCIQDKDKTERGMYRVDDDTVIVLDVFAKKTQTHHKP